MMRSAQGDINVAKRRSSSKQSNEVLAAADQTDPTARGLTGRDRVRPNRDGFIAAKEHADNVLGLDEKVSDGMRRSLQRFKNSPLTLMMEIINDDEQPWDRKLDAAHKAFPYLHRKLEDVHGASAQGSGAGAGAGNSPGNQRTGPTINLTVNRPQAPTVQINTVEREVPAAEAKPDEASNGSEAAKQEGKPKAFKKPKGNVK
jgi:hypothetical protein